MADARRLPIDRGRLAWLVGGVLALVAGSLLGWNGDLLTVIATPPPLVRAALVAVSALIALRLLGLSVMRLEAGRHIPPGELTSRNVGVLVRAVRLVFLAVAALAAAAGWLLGHPLPLVVALVIAGVDVLETTFLLLVVSVRRDA